jgi:hypothetical protein
MIELTRFLLAAIVAQTHIWTGSNQWMGQQAVFAFYTLSGYLITCDSKSPVWFFSGRHKGLPPESRSPAVACVSNRPGNDLCRSDLRPAWARVEYQTIC